MIVNKRKLAEVFGVAEETITNWMKAGMPVLTQRRGSGGNEYETADCIRWQFLRETGGDDALDLNQERARLAKAQADRAELDAAELKGEMVRYEELSPHWVARGAAMRARLLTMSTKIAPRVRVAISDAEAATLIDVEILEALAEISGDGVPDRVRTRRSRSAKFAQTPADTDGERVGGRVAVPVQRKRSRAGEVADE